MDRIDTTAAIANIVVADSIKYVGSKSTYGCASQVPGNVYTDGFDRKYIILYSSIFFSSVCMYHCMRPDL